MDPQNFEFSKNNDYKPQRQWLMNKQWKKIIGSDSQANPILLL